MDSHAARRPLLALGITASRFPTRRRTGTKVSIAISQ